MNDFVTTIKEFRKARGWSQQFVADKVNVHRSTYRDYESGKCEPNINTMICMAGLFEVSLDRLLGQYDDKPSFDQQKIRILPISVDKADREYIEFVPLKAQAGYLNGFQDPTFVEELPKFNLPRVDTGTYRAFEIKGDSMAPPIEQGTIIIGKYVENFSFIKNLNTYIIITKDDGVVYKRVLNKSKSKNKLILLSDNPSYEAYSIQAGNILEMWSYYAHLSFGYSASLPGQLHSFLTELDLDQNVKGLDDIIDNQK